jgi:hypothetical protein
MRTLDRGVRSSRWRGWGKGGLIVAVMGGWVVFLSWLCLRVATGPRLGGLPALPAYRLELGGDAEPHRPRSSAESLVTGEMLTVLLRPVEAVTGPVAVKAFVEQGGYRRAWAVHFERSEAGAFILRAPVRSLPSLKPGRWRLSFLIGRPWALPPGPAAAHRLDPGDDWYLLEGELEIAAT